MKYGDYQKYFHSIKPNYNKDFLNIKYGLDYDKYDEIYSLKQKYYENIILKEDVRFIKGAENLLTKLLEIEKKFIIVSNTSSKFLSYKLSKYMLDEKLFEVCSQILGETLGKSDEYSNNINGVSISPKKNYYIIRIWIKDNKYASKNNYNIIIPKFSTLMYKNHSEEQ